MTMKYTVAVNFLHSSAYLDSDRICLGKGSSYSKNILQLKLATEKNRDLPNWLVTLYNQPNVPSFYHNAFYCGPVVHPDIRLDRVIPNHFFQHEDSTNSP